jgi:hypothetical protein
VLPEPMFRRRRLSYLPIRIEALGGMIGRAIIVQR